MRQLLNVLTPVITFTALIFFGYDRTAAVTAFLTVAFMLEGIYKELKDR